MDRAVFERMAKQEETHWWFAARRRIVESRIARLDLPPAARILEAGCGTGGNLAMLKKYGTVEAFEPDDMAREVATQKNGKEVTFGALPAPLSFEPRSFDMAVACDVMEHVEDDEGGFHALGDLLKPSGHFILTVPAMPFLWSEHDVRHHHFRRYTKRNLSGKLMRAGFDVEMISYFNTALFPAILASRWVKNLLPLKAWDDEGAVPPRPINDFLCGLFAGERRTLGSILHPVGVSLLAVARRKTEK